MTKRLDLYSILGHFNPFVYLSAILQLEAEQFNFMTVYDIMSILKQPSGRKDNPVNKSFAEGCTESHSTEFLSDTKNHIKECAEESSATAGNKSREKGSEHDSMLKVVKIEPVDKVTIDLEEHAVSENERVFHPRYGYAF